jgi:hypothetical protein
MENRISKHFVWHDARLRRVYLGGMLFALKVPLFTLVWNQEKQLLECKNAVDFPQLWDRIGEHDGEKWKKILEGGRKC